MDYRLENLLPSEFEKLINTICQHVLGTGTVSFSDGKDGGRDGRFEGTANEYPSKTSKWRGRFIIQAKHTSNYKASCSDNTFHGNKTSLVNKEIDRLKKLIKTEEVIDNYIIFTNRKETSKREDAISYIKQQTSIKNVEIVGKVTLHNYLKQHDNIAKLFKVGHYALPLIITEFDIREVITTFGGTIPTIRRMKTIEEDEIVSIKKDKKNKLNNLSETYYANQIRRKSIQHFDDIDNFLQDPKNEKYTTIYYNFADELDNKIEVKRSAFDKFEEIFMFLYDIIFEQNSIELKDDRRLIWIFLHHLYFNCHTGRVE